MDNRVIELGSQIYRDMLKIAAESSTLTPAYAKQAAASSLHFAQVFIDAAREEGAKSVDEQINALTGASKP